MTVINRKYIFSTQCSQIEGHSNGQHERTEVNISINPSSI